MVNLVERLDQRNFKDLLKSAPESSYEPKKEPREAYKSDHNCDSCLTCDGCNNPPSYVEKR